MPGDWTGGARANWRHEALAARVLSLPVESTNPAVGQELSLRTLR